MATMRMRVHTTHHTPLRTPCTHPLPSNRHLALKFDATFALILLTAHLAAAATHAARTPSNDIDTNAGIQHNSATAVGGVVGSDAKHNNAATRQEMAKMTTQDVPSAPLAPLAHSAPGPYAIFPPLIPPMMQPAPAAAESKAEKDKKAKKKQDARIGGGIGGSIGIAILMGCAAFCLEVLLEGCCASSNSWSSSSHSRGTKSRAQNGPRVVGQPNALTDQQAQKDIEMALNNNTTEAADPENPFDPKINYNVVPVSGHAEGVGQGFLWNEGTAAGGWIAPANANVAHQQMDTNDGLYKPTPSPQHPTPSPEPLDAVYGTTIPQRHVAGVSGRGYGHWDGIPPSPAAGAPMHNV